MSRRCDCPYLSPNGTATSGTLYIRGRHAQYAVRVFGTTGRTRVLQYDTGRKNWISRQDTGDR